MTIEELNKMIQEELKAYLNEEQTDEAYHEDGDDDVKVTTDEPAAATGEEALDLLRQIYDMIKPQVEDEMEDEQADDESEDETEMDDVEDSAEEEEGDPEPDEEEIEEATMTIREAAGMPNPDELVALIMSMGIPAAMLAAAGGESKLRRLISAAGNNVKKRVQAIRAFLAGIPSNDMKGMGSDQEMEEAVGYANYTADQVSKVKADAEDVNKGLNESVERFKKLANIKG
jgi:hypothetical protein